LSRRHLISLIGPLLVLGIACNAGPLLGPEPTIPQPSMVTAAAPTLRPTSTASPVPPDTGWQTIEPGLEYRLRRWFDGAGETVETMHILRVDPAAYQFRVAYDPVAPASVKEWAVRSGAMITVNGGYFTPENLATGLLIVDGVVHGTSYAGFGGMVAISSEGVGVRSLAEQPYVPGESLTGAIQSFPMLVLPGGSLGFPEEDGIPSRRTVMGEDRAGRILIIVCPNGTFTLHKLAVELVGSDLDLHVALNLDGGTSTGLWVASAEMPVQIPSLVGVPAVLLIDSRR
jgi:hypothetical protein